MHLLCRPIRWAQVSLDSVTGLAAEAGPAVKAKLPHFTAQHLANVAWAVAKLTAGTSQVGRPSMCKNGWEGWRGLPCI
jgi:hypothetical protein